MMPWHALLELLRNDMPEQRADELGRERLVRDGWQRRAAELIAEDVAQNGGGKRCAEHSPATHDRHTRVRAQRDLAQFTGDSQL